MNKIIITFLSFVTVATSTFAQELPQLSPRSTVSQIIGLTEFTIDYSRPSVREREIFGNSIPYDEIWRTGANKRSVITINHDVKFGENTLKAGSYGLLTLPSESSWIVIFNEEIDGWGESDYKSDKDVLKIEAEVIRKDMKTQTLWIGFDRIEAASADFVIAFDQIEVRIPVSVEVEQRAWDNIERALKEKPEDARVLRNAANYAFKQNQKLEQAIEWISFSIEIEDNWYSNWVKAQILNATGDGKNSIKFGEKALSLGTELYGDEFKYAEMMRDEMSKW